LRQAYWYTELSSTRRLTRGLAIYRKSNFFEMELPVEGSLGGVMVVALWGARRTCVRY